MNLAPAVLLGSASQHLDSASSNLLVQDRILNVLLAGIDASVDTTTCAASRSECLAGTPCRRYIFSRCGDSNALREAGTNMKCDTGEAKLRAERKQNSGLEHTLNSSIRYLSCSPRKQDAEMVS